MVGVAQAVERLIVDQVVVGSNPITHPISFENIENGAGNRTALCIAPNEMMLKNTSGAIRYSFVDSFPFYASVVQLDRAIDFGSISWGFKSLRTHVSMRR